MSKHTPKKDWNKMTPEWHAMTADDHREALLRGIPGGWVVNWGRFAPKSEE